MGNPNNLLKGEQKHKFTLEDRAKALESSIKARREKRDLRRALEALLEKDFKHKNEHLSGAELIALKQMEKAIKGSTKAFEVIRDTSGQKPVEKVMIAEVEQSVIDEVEAMVTETTEKDDETTGS